MRFGFLVIVLFFAGCSVTSNHPTSSKFVITTDTMEIIRQAAASAPEGVKGDYVLNIKAAGRQGPIVYLNTEFDYRDQRNVTVALHPNVTRQLEAQYGISIEAFFIGKTLRVNGDAQRVRIDFINAQRKSSGKYYFQTHIRITDSTQIEVINESA